jgi:hypothetical protein
VIQLDNTTKGNTAMTPQEEALQAQIVGLPVIQELKENDVLIMEKLGNLEIGQTEIEERLDEGAGEFKLLWSEVKVMKKSIDDLGVIFSNGIDKLAKEIFDSKLDSAISNATKMAQENQELKKKLDSQDSKAWDIKKIIIGALVGLALLGVGVALGWKQ